MQSSATDTTKAAESTEATQAEGTHCQGGKGKSTEYHLHVGKETIQYALPTNNASSMGLKAHPLQYVSFFGKCYHCRYSAHSQKYCPLRLCKQCKQYGHSESVCWKKQLMPPSRAYMGWAQQHPIIYNSWELPLFFGFVGVCSPEMIQNPKPSSWNDVEWLE